MTTQAIALTLATLVAAISPLLLRFVKLDGLTMSALSFLVALLIAVVASLITGDLRLDRESLLAVLSGSAAFWTVQQMIYAFLKRVQPTVVGAKALRKRT